MRLSQQGAIRCGDGAASRPGTAVSSEASIPAPPLANVRSVFMPNSKTPSGPSNPKAVRLAEVTEREQLTQDTGDDDTLDLDESVNDAGANAQTRPEAD
jgi:hypothetical protein